jgi:hypothetical protein
MLIHRVKALSTRKLPAGNLLFALLLSVLAIAIPANAQTSWSYSGVDSGTNVGYSSNPLTAASDGNIYWPERDGNGGAIYQIAPSGGVMVIYSFNCTGTAPCQPVGAVLQGADGFLYGITNSGGANSSGAFFKVALDGSNFADLYDFNPAVDGGGPTGGLTLGSDGNFYGVSNFVPFLGEARQRSNGHNAAPQRLSRTAGHHTDGSVSCGSNPSAVFFRMTPGGLFTPIYCASDNKLPATSTSLVQASDGNFYGISTDGSDSGGVIYQLTTAGGYTLLGQALPSGDSTFGALAGGPDGKFYVEVSSSGCGSTFQFDPKNAYAQVDFADLDCTDASNPYAWQLYLASDGAFYSAAPDNTGSGAGAVYRVDMSGTVTYPHDFVAGAGQNPYTAPVQNSAGTFFGTTGSMGGGGPDSSNAVIYSLTASPAPAAPVTLSSSSSGNSVTLNWTVNNASPLTPPNCVALVDNSTGVSGWSGMVFGAFTDSIYSGSATFTQTAGTTVNYEIACPSQGAAAAAVYVNSARPSKTMLTIGPSSSMVTGTAATLSVMVARLNNCGAVNNTNCAVHRDTPGYPSGTVTFSWNNQTIGTVTLNNGVATLPVSTTNLAAQSYSVTATYSGSDVFATSSDTEAGTLTAIPTSVNLTAADIGRTPRNTGTISAGDNAKLTATVTAFSGSATPSGEITFHAGSVDLGSASLNNAGVATLTLSSAGVPAGVYTMTASYSGNRTHAAATSSGVSVSLSKAVSFTTVSAAYSTILPGGADQLTATVTSNGDAPTGRVHFLWGNYFICAGTLNAGVATCSGAAPTNTGAGVYMVTAAYMGDHNNDTSTSLPTAVSVVTP